MAETSFQVYTFRIRSRSPPTPPAFSHVLRRAVRLLSKMASNIPKMCKNIDTNKSEVQHVLNFVTNLVIYIKIKKIVSLFFYFSLSLCLLLMPQCCYCCCCCCCHFFQFTLDKFPLISRTVFSDTEAFSWHTKHCVFLI